MSGVGLGAGSRPQIRLNHYSGGVISYHTVVGPLIPDIGTLSISRKKSGGGRNRKGGGKKFDTCPNTTSPCSLTNLQVSVGDSNVLQSTLYYSHDTII